MESDCQELANAILLLGLRERLVQPANRLHEPINDTSNELLHVMLVLGRRVFAQGLANRSDDLGTGGHLAVELVQQVPELGLRNTAQPFELQ